MNMAKFNSLFHVSQQDDRRDRKKGIKSSSSKLRRSDLASYARLPLLAPVKQLSAQQQDFVRGHRCFLVRNLEKVRRIRDSLQKKVREGQLASVDGDGDEGGARGNGRRRPEDMILTGLTALATARSMQTRRLASARDDPNVTKVVRLAQLLREILVQVTTVAGRLSFSCCCCCSFPRCYSDDFFFLLVL